MALTGIQIYKLLPQTNCKDCGFPTCLAFAMKLAAKQAELKACPYVSDTSKAQLESASAPPIRLVTVAGDGTKVEAGNEVVMFRHEKTFFRRPGFFIRVKDTTAVDAIKARVAEADAYVVDYVGIKLGVDGFAVEAVFFAGFLAAAFELVFADLVAVFVAVVAMSGPPIATKRIAVPRLRLPPPGADIGACGASVESPRIDRTVDMSNQNGDIDAFNSGNSKSSKDVRQVHPEARTTRRVGDRPQGRGRGLARLPAPFLERAAARNSFRRRCNGVYDSVVHRGKVHETSDVRRIFQRRKRPQQRFRPDGP